jgi:hypothetical protein
MARDIWMLSFHWTEESWVDIWMQIRFYITTLYIQVEHAFYVIWTVMVCFFINRGYVVGVAYARLITVFHPDDGPYRAEPYRRQ